MDELLAEIAKDPYLTKIDNYVPSAWIGHAPFLKFLIRELRPEKFVELGSHNGFSYFVALQAMKEQGINARAWAVDHWQGDNHAGYYEESVYEGVAKRNHPYEEFSTLLKMTFIEASSLFENNSLDLLHIDGHHSYDSVLEDFNTWLPKMSSNGVILLHDIFVRREGFGVHVLWNSIRQNYKTLQFVGSHGLGVVFLGEIPQGGVKDIFEMAQAGNFDKVQGCFGSISDDLIQNYRYLENANLTTQIENLQREILELRIHHDLILESKVWRYGTRLAKFYRHLTLKNYIA